MIFWKNISHQEETEEPTEQIEHLVHSLSSNSYSATRTGAREIDNMTETRCSHFKTLNHANDASLR